MCLNHPKPPPYPPYSSRKVTPSTKKIGDPCLKCSKFPCTQMKSRPKKGCLDHKDKKL